MTIISLITCEKCPKTPCSGLICWVYLQNVCLTYMLFKKHMCLWDRTYFKMSCYISGKVFKCTHRWIWLSLKSFLSLLSNQSDIKRLNNTVKVVLVYIPWCGSTDHRHLPKLMSQENNYMISKYVFLKAATNDLALYIHVLVFIYLCTLCVDRFVFLYNLHLVSFSCSINSPPQ